jgi:cyclic pyranopterin phosphate synthase
MAEPGPHLPIVPAAQEAGRIDDAFGRPLRDLRVSVTDRCNLRCGYCMPRAHFHERFRFLPRAEILSFEEIVRLAKILVERAGLRKIRLTGGEPLLRSELVTLVRMLSALEGVEVALTTNGVLLAEHAEGFAQAGLKRVTVSLDALDDAVFRRMADTDVSVTRVLGGIQAAQSAGLGPVKINTVVRRGINDQAIVELARHFKGSGIVVRFIEFMDVGTTNGWRLDEVVSGHEIVERIARELPLEPLEPTYRGEVARRWRYRDGSGEIGVITSVTQPFCGQCSRLRLSADGKLFTCLFSSVGTDVRGPMRSRSDNDELGQLIERLWHARQDRYSALRSAASDPAERVEMSYIGG